MAASESKDNLDQEQTNEVRLPRRRTGDLARIGILALPLSGLLTLVGLLGRYNAPNPRADFEAAARVANSTGFFVSQFVGNVLGLTLLVFGILALTAFLANTRVRALALVAMILSIFGVALVLSAMGVTTYALPVISQAYLDGQGEATAIADALFGSTLRSVIFIPVFISYSAGFILFGVAIWRSGVLPRGAALSLGLHAPLVSSFTRTQPTVGTVIGALLFILGGVIVASSVLRKPPAGEAEAGKE